MIVTNLGIDPCSGPTRHKLFQAALSSFDCFVIVAAVSDVIADLYTVADDP